MDVIESCTVLFRRLSAVEWRYLKIRIRLRIKISRVAFKISLKHLLMFIREKNIKLNFALEYINRKIKKREKKRKEKRRIEK